jgi:2-C-methyl-D-erythritol 4-phosphate cytidylyltransferase/2-C-methyl-D-erythritol 2,4-cyclodiphosphate synthase
MTDRSVHVVLLAAGKGVRLGGEIAKPWCDLGGKPLLCHSLERLARHPGITSGVIVATGDALKNAAALAGIHNWTAVEGGSERAFSVKAGLNALSGAAPEYVLIHDSARPFVTDAVITGLIDSLDGGADAAIPGLPPSDSLKNVTDGDVDGRVERDGVWRAQTPQAFRYALIKSCHDRDKKGRATDDSSLIEDEGGVVRMIKGDALLEKITTSGDLAHAEIIFKGLNTKENPSAVPGEPGTRMATGFDVHRFASTPGPIMLGGIALDHEFGLDAHSDGDVALHALTDAIYGLIADGDIGSHFPPSDDQWKDRDSSFFLAEARAALKAKGGALSFVDLTIIAEMPKIDPHRDAIRTSLAGLLELELDRISVKATTSEGLGVTGRREGIAAQAAATAIFKGEAL